ncbi:MAG: hypothetical protein LBF38_01280 [Deltaproteobacteria bacterium]|jgi:hypothetical protein|nr:hypothetical protein [Deltaproteobacteria bacterium]
MNKISFISKFTKRLSKIKDSPPKVGIYWFIKDPKKKRNSEILVSRAMDVVSASQARAGFIDSPYEHFGVWESVVKDYPWLIGDEYEYWPRGRVVLNVEEFMWYVYLDSVLDKPKYHAMILEEFNILDKSYVFKKDSHYAEAKYAHKFASYKDRQKRAKSLEADWDF